MTTIRSGVVVLDGGLATELEARGHDLSDRLWSARLLLTDPAAIEDVHLAYFRAGAQVATTASYQASVDGFAAAGIDRAGALGLIAQSVVLARRAARPPPCRDIRGRSAAPRRRLRRAVRRDARRRLGVPRRLRPGPDRPGRLPSAADRGAHRGRRGPAGVRDDPDDPRGRGPGPAARRGDGSGLAELLVPRRGDHLGR